MITDAPLADCSDAVRAYLALADGTDRAAAIVGFASDAHVTDDGHDYRGTVAIRAWLDRPAGDYSFTATPVAAAAEERSGATVVTCRVEGTFPGSPVDLDYRFRLDEEQRISRLEIVLHEPATVLH
jgi:hypothetical protein